MSLTIGSGELYAADPSYCLDHTVPKAVCGCNFPAPPESPETPEKDVWASLINAAELDKIEFPPLTYLVDGLIPAGGVALFAGAPKIGKSVLSTGISVAVALGGRALGQLDVLDTGRVLMVALDDTSKSRFQRRLREIAGGPLPSNLDLMTTPIGRGNTAEANLRRYLTPRADVRLVVIDTLATIKSERQGSDVYGFDVESMQFLNRLAHDFPEVSFLVLTHTKKGEIDDPVQAMSGSFGISGSVDHLLVLEGTRGTPNRVLHIISRDAEDRKLALRFSNGQLLLSDEDPDDLTLRMTADQAAIVRALREFPDGATAKELEPLVPGVSNVGTKLGELYEKRWVQRLNRGVYSA